MIKNIVFDMGGVLIEFNPQQFIDSYPLNDDEKNILMREVFHSKYWSLADFGAISIREAAFKMQQNVPANLKQYVTKLALDWPILSQPIEGMYSLALKLNENGYNLFLLSNAADNQPQYWKRYPYYFLFDKKIISYQVNTVKPDPNIYRMLMDKYELAPEECLFIDDSHTNVAGAEMTGMQGIVFQNLENLIEQLRQLNIEI